MPRDHRVLITIALLPLESVDVCIRQLIIDLFDSRWRANEMNDANIAAENDESTEACDVVELGEVSTDTKGFPAGRTYDGFGGLWG